jgi:N-acetylated-alpha-linked acidic dipeptidase
MSDVTNERARTGIAAVAAAVLVLGAGASPPRDTITGFAPDSLILQRQIEARFLRLPSASRLRQFHRYLTAEPHVAGSPRNRHLAEWQRQQWIAWGIEDVHIVTHEVLLPYPQEVRVEMTAPKRWQASLREDAVAGDPDTKQDPGPTYHAFSASGDVAGEVVYAGSGNPEHYDWLTAQGIDLRGKIALVRYSVPYSYRGFKALTAQQRGLAGILIYSDPADDGFGKGKTYPAGPWGPESHIQRGGIPFDFLVPGDPLTPGWASVPGARRIAAEEAVSIPKIISVPLSYRDARVILEALGGPEVPATWRGGLPISYRAGGGGAVVRMVVRIDSAVRQIQTVVGRIRGSQQPEQEVILGNHRDAWVFGGVDPSSGSASLMELARSLGTLLRGGFRPKRTIVLASWDAEEFTLTSSTEWGEQYAEALQRRAIAYINVDSAASGPVFTASAVPSLNRLVAEVARDVRDAGSRQSIAQATARAGSAERGALPNAQGQGLVNNRLGSGSDYTVFLNFLGIPIIDISFDGPYGVYHSIYDNHQWVSRVGDPGFRYHTAMTKLWGLMALRLANADVLPFDYPAYAAALKGFATEVEKRWTGARPRATETPIERSPFAEVHEAIGRFAAAAARTAQEQEQASAQAATIPRDELNARLMRVERALLDPDGIPGRPWYRHLVYAPKFTYAAEILPGAAEAIAAGDEVRLREQCRKLAAAIDRAAEALGK